MYTAIQPSISSWKEGLESSWKEGLESSWKEGLESSWKEGLEKRSLCDYGRTSVHSRDPG